MSRLKLQRATAVVVLAVSAAVGAQVPDRSPRTTQARPIPNQPGTEPKIALPAGKFAMSRLPGAVQLVKTDAGWRARDVAVGTTGGYNPVTLTLDAGTHSSLFELGVPRSGRIAGSTAGRDAFAQPEASPTTGPADALNRALRFKGAPVSALPDAIPVKITARDGKGASLTATTTFYPVAPSVSSVTGYEGKTTGQTLNLSINLVGLGAARGFKELSAISGCGFEQNPTVSYAGGSEYGGGYTGSTDTRRIFRIARLALSSCSGLTFKFALKFPGSSEYLEPFTLKTPAFQLVRSPTYTFTNTWDLQGKLGFALYESNGKCQGQSEMPTQPSFPVGVMKDGGDITFKIRSGPLVTHCVYASKAWVLPDGFALMKFDLSSTRSGPEERAPDGSYATCCTGLGDGKMCSGMNIPNLLAAGFSFVRGLKPLSKRDRAQSLQVSGWQRPLVTPDNVILFDISDNRYTTVIPPLTVSPTCLSTLLNDQFVTIRIDEIGFTGPPGVAFP